MNCLVVAVDASRGIMYEFARVRNGARAVPMPSAPTLDGSTPMRDVPVWMCEQSDVPALVDEISKLNTGIQLSVYQLVSTHVRLPGELKSLKVTKDGELPF